MSEGGMLPWKIQKVKQPKNGRLAETNYTDICNPLPNPPKGHMWVQDESSREWKLMPVVVANTAADGGNNMVAMARPANDGDCASNNNLVCSAIPIIEVQAQQPATIVGGDGIRYHEVLPTDTFQGICLRYKVTPTELRQANRMMGTNIKLAPTYPKLVIPANEKNKTLDNKSPTNEEKIANLISRVSKINKISYSEAKAYLEMNEWSIEDAIANIQEDDAWSNDKSTEKRQSFHDDVGIMGIE